MGNEHLAKPDERADTGSVGGGIQGRHARTFSGDDRRLIGHYHQLQAGKGGTNPTEVGIIADPVGGHDQPSQRARTHHIGRSPPDIQRRNRRLHHHDDNIHRTLIDPHHRSEASLEVGDDHVVICGQLPEQLLR